jgi:hypothetical protein
VDSDIVVYRYPGTRYAFIAQSMHMHTGTGYAYPGTSDLSVVALIDSAAAAQVDIGKHIHLLL